MIYDELVSYLEFSFHAYGFCFILSFVLWGGIETVEMGLFLRRRCPLYVSDLVLDKQLLDIFDLKPSSLWGYLILLYTS